jgi:hypothetical protein
MCQHWMLLAVAEAGMQDWVCKLKKNNANQKCMKTNGL